MVVVCFIVDAAINEINGEVEEMIFGEGGAGEGGLDKVQDEVHLFLIRNYLIYISGITFLSFLFISSLDSNAHVIYCHHLGISTNQKKKAV